MKKEENDYDIFENAEEYLHKEFIISKDYVTHKGNFCYTQENDAFKSYFNVRRICEIFIKFFEELKSLYHNDQTKYSKYREYLNYWINYKLVTNSFPDEHKPKFYEFIRNNYREFAPNGELKNNIYQIEDKSFNNMYILYELYRLYYELENNNQQKCMEFYEKFVKNYNVALNKCYFDDEKLCNPLERFKKFYDGTRSTKLHLCSAKGLPEIPKFGLPISPHGTDFKNKFAYHLYQLSNKKMHGHSIISSVKYPNLVKLLSLNYNMLLISNIEEKKENMMNILYEFIKFSKDRSTITFLDSLIKKNSLGIYDENVDNVPFLNLFIKEFFQDFYQKEKGEYELIYDDCSTDSSEKSYCSKYKMCNEELGYNIFTLKDKLQELIEHKVTSAQVLASKYSSGETSMHTEGEDNVSSNTTPINVGVGVGALFTLSFLYKFTPISSFVNRALMGKGDTMYNYDEDISQDILDNNSNFNNYISEN
ncbi:PIR Superfamily Protein [Plasmodium ovale curtisi]|uniref:PIR Superfamily Protein n=1 Tax=Plasmodium ovale curtisi TaxID=864141 RepID=A0A1A8WAX3_PLAOA|nr:PIR Superfamily Protein [Plasmodium ovale curtisi]